jgi:hypothetical protein
MKPEDQERKRQVADDKEIEEFRLAAAKLDLQSLTSVLEELGFAVGRDIKPSEQCGGDVTRTATELGPTREAAEDAALHAARAAARRGCKEKKCGEPGQTCSYVEKSSAGSSSPVLPATNPPSFTATMTTTGSCGCE